MILDARYFEKYVHPREGLMKKEHRTLVFTGHAIELCLVDARTFGGVIRFSIDNKGLRRSTGSSSQPMRIRNPFRFAEMSAYRIMTQFQLLGLPENIEAFVEPTPQMAKEGFLILSSSYREGAIEFTVIVTRKMEVSPDYPVAELKFRELETEKSADAKIEAYIGSEADLFGSGSTGDSDSAGDGDDTKEEEELLDDDEDDTDSFLDDDSDSFLDDDSNDSFLDDDELDGQSLETEIPVIVEGLAEVITGTIEETKPEKSKPKPKPKTSRVGKSGTKSKTKTGTK